MHEEYCVMKHKIHCMYY